MLATGAFNVAQRAGVRRRPCRRRSRTLTPMEYRNPDQLAEGGVLVVGASATGVQIADEIQRSGRPVTLAVGEHVRAPRTYRGRDIHWWMDAAGVLDERYDEVDDIVRARSVPSMQLVGSPERATFDLNALARRSACRLVGRLAGDPRRQRAVLRLAAQQVRARRPQARPAARHHRRVGDRRTASTARSPPPHRFAPTGVDGAAARSTCDLGKRRDRDDHLGDRLPPRLLVARRAGARPQGHGPPRRRGRRRRPACT